MAQNSLIIIIGIGGFFVILGIIGLFWGRKEESSWYSSITDHVDVREFLDHSPVRPEPNALRIGGRICLAVGIVVLLVALGFYLLGIQPT
jgi:hypothetical protein